jgi:hypothetical protein
MKKKRNINERYFNPDEKGEVVDHVDAPLIGKHADSPQRIDEEMEYQEYSNRNKAG